MLMRWWRPGLRGKGNAVERWKTTIGLISKKETMLVQHAIFYISLPLFWACSKTHTMDSGWWTIEDERYHFYRHFPRVIYNLVPRVLSYLPNGAGRVEQKWPMTGPLPCFYGCALMLVPVSHTAVGRVGENPGNEVGSCLLQTMVCETCYTSVN